MKPIRILILTLLFGTVLLCLPEPSPARSISGSFPSSPDDEPFIIAVMPFTNVSGQKDYDWLSVGIGEVLTTKLGSLPYFKLVERIKLSDALKEIELAQTGLITEENAPKAGKMMGAEELVIGSFQIAGQNIRIDARFVDVETGKVHVFAGSSGEVDKLFEAEDRITASILASLNCSLTDEEKKLVMAKPTTSMEAFKLYSQAADIYTPQGKTLNDDQRIAYLEQSTQMDPNFAMAYSSLGNIYAVQRQDYDRAAAYYQKVVILQPYNPAPRYWLIRAYQRQGNVIAAQQEAKKIEAMRRFSAIPNAGLIQQWPHQEMRRGITPKQQSIRSEHIGTVQQGTRTEVRRPLLSQGVQPRTNQIVQQKRFLPPSQKSPSASHPQSRGKVSKKAERERKAP